MFESPFEVDSCVKEGNLPERLVELSDSLLSIPVKNFAES